MDEQERKGENNYQRRFNEWAVSIIKSAERSNLIGHASHTTDIMQTHAMHVMLREGCG